MAYADTGLGWYLDEDYLLTTGSTRIARISNSRFLPLDSSGIVRNLAKFDLENEPYRIFYAGTEDSGIYSFFLKGVSSGGDLLAGVYLISNQTFTAHIGCTSGETVIYDVPTATPLFDSQTGYYYLPVAVVGSGTYSYDTVPADLDNTFYMSLINVPNSISDYINVLFGTSTIGRTKPVLTIPYDMGQGATLTQLIPMVEAYAFWGRTDAKITPFVVTKGTIISIDGTGQNGFVRDHEVYMEYALHSWLAEPTTTRPADFPYIEAQSWGDILTVALGTLGEVSPFSIDKEIAKVNGGPGSFAVVTYPHNGGTVCVGVGISSIGIPNSAATVAVDGTNGSYNTFNREGMQFTMFYTEQLTGTLTANVPVVTLDTDISALPGLYEPRLFLAVADAAQIHVGEYDPYSGAGESEPGAEEATFDFDSTEIDFGNPPTVTAAGMVELFIPSTSNLASLAQYLWAGSFDPDNFKKLFADPMDAIIGLQIVPVTATEIGTTPDTLYVGNISTGLSMPKASRQYVPVDCGSLTIPRRLGSYLDYSPHTEMQLYLPYVGFVDISPDDCMGGTVSVKYMVDIIGGTCVAQVKCNNHVLYEYAAACSCQVPVSAGQYQNIVLGSVRGAVGLVSGVLGAAGGGLFSGLSEAADAAMSMTKPKIQRSGGFGGSSGLMGHQTPYIIYTVPRLIVPGRQNNFIGYPSFFNRTL